MGPIDMRKSMNDPLHYIDTLYIILTSFDMYRPFTLKFDGAIKQFLKIDRRHKAYQDKKKALPTRYVAPFFSQFMRCYLNTHQEIQL